MTFDDLKKGMIVFERYEHPWGDIVYIIIKKTKDTLYCKSISFGEKVGIANEKISKADINNSEISGGGFEIVSSRLMKDIIVGIL